MQNESPHKTKETTKGGAPRGRDPKQPPKPRRKARPYKRMPQETLTLRVRDMKKKLAVLQSKTVLIEDRLGMHEEEVEPWQSIRIFGWWDQPRSIVVWDDLKHNNLSWRRLRFEYGFSAHALHTIQPQVREWVARGQLTLHDVPDMCIFPVNPFTDLGADLGEVWSMKWSAEELASMGVTYEQMLVRGITPEIMRCFSFPLSSWMRLGFGRRHVVSADVARVFGMEAGELRLLLPPEDDGDT